MADGHHKRVAHRWRLGLALGLGGVLALGSFYLLQLMNVADMDLQAQAHRNEPDYIVEKFSFVRMTPEGKPRYIIAGAKMTHRPSDDTAVIEQPYVQNLSDDKPPMTMRANQAHLDNATGIVNLLGGVHIERPEAPGAVRLTLDTPSLRLNTDEEEMETDQPVEIIMGTGKLTGVGMRANNATEQVRVFKNVRLVQEPPKK